MSETDQLYDRLIAPIEHQMKAVALRVVGDPGDAADVIQETLAQVWEKLRDIDVDRNPRAYILRICLSRAYDLLRRRATRRKHEAGAAEERPNPRARSLNPARRTERKDLARAVRDAVTELPSNQAKTVLLRASQDTSYAVIADILGCSEATARSHYSKGMARLREVLEEQDLL